MTKRVFVFRVIGNRNIGLGHIYRALTIASEFKNDKIIFVSDFTNRDKLVNLVPNKYDILIFEKSKIVNSIIKINPFVVFNDILSTKINDVQPLKKNGIKVINFEDLGKGSKYADLTVNEIFDKPLNKFTGVIWGSKYFFLRKEFENVKPNKFRKKIRNIIVTFGGSDQFNLTLKTYEIIKDICKEKKIKIQIVVGPAYEFYDLLLKRTYDDNNVEIHHSTGIISSIMSQCDLAISSNGRTIFELAHMNVPTIAVPQHKREQTHSFSSLKTGFILLSIYKKTKTGNEIGKNFKKIVNNNLLRKKLYDGMIKFNFVSNRNKVINIINETINHSNEH
tara:strand:- start:625 stop:1629 length:1005 start_codon:yes stop_codon:yes gene_type:complete